MNPPAPKWDGRVIATFDAPRDLTEEQYLDFEGKLAELADDEGWGFSSFKDAPDLAQGPTLTESDLKAIEEARDWIVGLMKEDGIYELDLDQADDRSLALTRIIDHYKEGE